MGLKRAKLEQILEGLEKIANPRAELEQYQTPARLASEILFDAYFRGDVEEKRVADLGCGNGVFLLGAKLLGAAEATGVEADPSSLDVARRNAQALGLDVEWKEADVEDAEGVFDTVFQNPPFGSQNRHADLPFLRMAMGVGRVVYSLHNEKAVKFLQGKIRAFGGHLDYTKKYKFPLPYQYPFHTKEIAYYDVVLFRIVMPIDR